MSAPEAVVRRVQEALGCERCVDRDGRTDYCGRHHFGWLHDRNCCPHAERAADAAFTASLEWAAEQLDFYGSAVDPIRWLEQLAGDS